jgi:hypothetical protein
VTSEQLCCTSSSCCLASAPSLAALRSLLHLHSPQSSRRCQCTSARRGPLTAAPQGPAVLSPLPLLSQPSFSCRIRSPLPSHCITSTGQCPPAATPLLIVDLSLQHLCLPPPTPLCAAVLLPQPLCVPLPLAEAPPLVAAHLPPRLRTLQPTCYTTSAHCSPLLATRCSTQRRLRSLLTASSALPPTLAAVLLPQNLLAARSHTAAHCCALQVELPPSPYHCCCKSPWITPSQADISSPGLQHSASSLAAEFLLPLHWQQPLQPTLAPQTNLTAWKSLCRNLKGQTP